MKKSVLLNTYIMAVVALAMTFTVACTRPGQSHNSFPNGVRVSDRGQATGPVTGGQAPQSQADGTTDGAGGNGTNGKIYEAYIVDPQSLPAYKEVLEDKIKSMDKLWAEAEAAAYPSQKNSENIFSVMWKMKKWYIAPVSLKTLNKQTIGVEFTNEKTEQLALQTESEIWIDSRLFEKMSKEEQAKLLAHEFNMSLYLFKFQSLVDLCVSARSVSSDPDAYECSSFGDATDLLAPEAKRPLEKTDYANIRTFTATLMSKKFVSQKDLAQTLQSHGFDKRIFYPIVANNGSRDNVEFKAEELNAALKKAIYSQRLNGKCQGVQSGTIRNCAVEVKSTPTADGNEDLEVILKDADSAQVLRSVKVHFNNSIYNSAEGDKTFTFSEAGPIPKNEGEFYGSLKIFVTKYDKDSTPEVTGIVFITNVVTSAQKSKENPSLKCLTIETAPLKTKAPEQEAILVGPGHSIQETEARFYISNSGEMHCEGLGQN